MNEDFRYDCVLAAALAIMDFLDASPHAPKHELLSTIIFSMLHAMDRYEAGKEAISVGFSAN
ncbi:hypothetical protein [Singulisphaera sp. PoT]|uniref:hypothetical protein n=1 Tax=Singulisphaera sp. PoT TaxID=3411797 RepID=UPI003BF52083